MTVSVNACMRDGECYSRLLVLLIRTAGPYLDVNPASHSKDSLSILRRGIPSLPEALVPSLNKLEPTNANASTTTSPMTTPCNPRRYFPKVGRAGFSTWGTRHYHNLFYGTRCSATLDNGLKFA